MSRQEARADAGWLALREPADAAARSRELVELVRPSLASDEGVVVHDLGCGTGSMGRWLAPQLAGAQHWVLSERDAQLLPRAAADPPPAPNDGAAITTETRARDITRLARGELSGAALVTASALLDMMSAEELERFTVTIADAGCPALVALSVTGEVELTPSDPFDRQVGDAFNAHQRRCVGGRTLLGPDAVGAAVDGLTRLGCEVHVRPSPWRLGPRQSALTRAWFSGWLGAACEQRPSLRADASPYARRRMAELAEGRLSVTVAHRDLLALPGRRHHVEGGARPLRPQA